MRRNFPKKPLPNIPAFGTLEGVPFWGPKYCKSERLAMDAKLIVTNLKENRLWAEEPVSYGPIGWPDEAQQVVVYPHLERQEFQGFGGAFTESAAYNWQKLPEDKRKAFLEAYFGENGLRYTQGRVHIGSCDFSLGHYDCVEDPEDRSLKTFQANRDDQYIIPLVQAAEAVAGRKISLLLSPWSPPGFMKDTGKRDQGGRLLPEYREFWASCMAKYAAHYREQGLNVERVSIQNEAAAAPPWDSCQYTAEEEGIFAADYLRPALDKLGLSDVKILAWDHNKDIFPYRAESTMSVPGAREAISGFGIHWYTGDHFEALGYVKEQYPDMELWFTEGCVEYGRFHISTRQKAEMYAHDILGNLKMGINGSIDWNLLLDAQGGPNHKDNFCEAPIMLTEDEKDFCLMSEYYYIGQFSRYIQPGARCLASSSWSSFVESVTFRNPDGSRATVLLNRTDNALPVYVSEGKCVGWHLTLKPHTIATLLY